jgi:ParB-like chromosome segregation protein Spo0J
LKTVSVKIADLSQDPANARKHDEKNIDSIIASLRRFGQQKPIVIDASKVVRAGSGTLEAAKRIGWETIECVETNLKGSDAIAYAIADNRTAELAEWDSDILAAQLSGLLTDDEALLKSSGFTVDELDELLIKSMANLEDDPEDDGSGNDAQDSDTLSIILLLTTQQEISFKKAIAKARKSANLETTAEAVLHIMEEWGNAQGQ